MGVCETPIAASQTSFVQATPSSSVMGVCVHVLRELQASVVQASLSSQSAGPAHLPDGAASPEELPPVEDVEEEEDELDVEDDVPPSAAESGVDEYEAHAIITPVAIHGSVRKNGALRVEAGGERVVDLAFTDKSLALKTWVCRRQLRGPSALGTI